MKKDIISKELNKLNTGKKFDNTRFYAHVNTENVIVYSDDEQFTLKQILKDYEFLQRHVNRQSLNIKQLKFKDYAITNFNISSIEKI